MDGLRASIHGPTRFSQRLFGECLRVATFTGWQHVWDSFPTLWKSEQRHVQWGEEEQQLQEVAFQSTIVSLRFQFKVPTHRWVSSKHCPLDPCSFVSQENDLPSMGLCFLGALGDNGMMNSKLSWCQSSVIQAWHLGGGCFHSEQLCTFGTTFQFEDPLTPAQGHISV